MITRKHHNYFTVSAFNDSVQCEDDKRHKNNAWIKYDNKNMSDTWTKAPSSASSSLGLVLTPGIAVSKRSVEIVSLNF